jgi:diguanylate cyclase (GGDEF)-like protein
MFRSLFDINLSLRQRSYISTLALFLTVLGIIYPVSAYILNTKFNVFEHQAAQKDLQRLNLLLDQQLHSLQIGVRDYSNWQECVDFIERKNPKFIEDNYNPEQMRNLDIDLFVIADANGQFIASRSLPEFAALPKSADLQNTPRPLAEGFLSAELVSLALKDKTPEARPLFVNGDWYYTSISGVRSDITGTSSEQLSTATVGVLVFARRLNLARKNHLAEVSQVDFELAKLQASDLGSKAIKPKITFTDATMSGRFYALDYAGGAAAEVRATTPRTLQKQFESYRNIILLNIVSAIVLSALLGWFLLEFGVLRRLRRLAADVEKIRTEALDHLDIDDRRHDEIDIVAKEFNRLIEERYRISGLWRHEALHDGLTGLGNRVALRHELQELEGHKTQSLSFYAVLLMDIDGFKFINDIHGHSIGDIVLSAMSKRLREALPESSTAFRLGGDEFAVLIREANSKKDIETVASNICEVMRLPIDTHNKQLELSVSIGLADSRYSDLDLQSGELLRRADVAMYEVKRRGKNGYSFYNETMLAEMTHLTELRNDLRLAIKDSQLQAWFQPIINSNSGVPIRVESLCRWRHAQRGWIAADRIIAIAEESQLIEDLDLLMLDQGLSSLKQMRRSWPNLQLSANLSARTLESPKLADKISKLLLKYSLSGEVLVCEITETALISDNLGVMQTIKDLCEQNIGFYLDDFGVGYSSLARMAQMTIAGIKLDGTFVRELEQGETRVCNAIIQLAGKLNMSVTAECVETAMQQEKLVQMGCQTLQGYFIAQPMPLNETLDWLQKQVLDGDGVMKPVQ